MSARGAAATILLVLTVVLLPTLLASHAGAAASTGGSPITITPLSPSPGSQEPSKTPTIQASFIDSAGTPIPSTVTVTVGFYNLTDSEGWKATPEGVTVPVPTILPLKNGVWNVTVGVADTAGHFTNLTWNFTVNPNATVAPAPVFSVKAQTVLVDIGIGAVVAVVAFFAYIWYLRQTTRFAFRKYFATHPIQKEYLVLYIPLVVAFVFVLLGLDYVTSTPGLPSYSTDLVIIIGVFIGLTAYGIDARRQLSRLRVFERAFAQLLFELADAMRGGLDPAKAMIELSKTHTNVLRKPLKIAADGLLLGRRFDAVLHDMVEPMKSPLIRRYAALIAEATDVGGETAIVIYRAAKDMDDFVKIEEERANQLTLPIAVIYIAFAVLMAVLFALLYIAPELGSLNIGLINGGGSALKGTTASTVPRLDVDTLHERFFELCIINSLGTGAIIGAFSEGRARYGIVHALALVAATTIAFLFIFP
ncbi:MAG: type II secretion system F family protein [Thermoplasmata archaeon]|nr:type II secretion system F family protein [Thermoplasmata archaeon]